MMLARSRLNTFALTFADHTSYLNPPYPFLVEVPEYPEVKAIGLTNDQRERNLEMLRRIAELASEHGIDFVFSTWMQGARLQELLETLSAQGVTQQQVASRVGVPPQYLSDVRCGRRGLTELFARRLGGEFGIDYQWLMGGKGPKGAIPLRGPAAGRAEPRASGLLMLPILPALVEGEPRDSPLWDGSLFEVSGAAAAAAGRAHGPYVLRFDEDDHHGRLRAGDLILISQETSDKAEIGVIRFKGRLMLARRLASGGWRSMTTGRRLAGKVEPVGCCIAILWASLKQDS